MGQALPYTELTRPPYTRQNLNRNVSFRDALKSAGIKPKASESLKRWADKELAHGKPLNFIPHQLAEVGECHPKTIYRALPGLLSAGLVVKVKPGSYVDGEAVLLTLGPCWPSSFWNRTKCPSPKNLSDLKGTTYHHPSKSNRPFPQSHPGNEIWKNHYAVEPKLTHERPKGPRPYHERVLAEILTQEGVSPKGIDSALNAARQEGRTKKALKDVEIIVEYLQSGPDWLKEEGKPGILQRAVADPARAAKLKRQAKYHKLKTQRDAKKAAREAAKKAWSASQGAEIKVCAVKIAIQLKKIMKINPGLPEPLGTTFAAWRVAAEDLPKSDHPAYLDFCEREGHTKRQFLHAALAHLGAEGQVLTEQLNQELDKHFDLRAGLIRERAYWHHLGKRILDFFKIRLE